IKLPTHTSSKMADLSDSDASKKKKPDRFEGIAETDEPVLLMRAKLGHRRISTFVTQKDLIKFHHSYSAILTVNCDNLLHKGEVKKKSKKQQAKLAKKAKTQKPASKSAQSAAAPSSSTSMSTSTPAAARPPSRRERKNARKAIIKEQKLDI